VLVRYNPEGDQNLKRRQSARLKRFSEYLHSAKSRSRFMFELLVPAEKEQLERFNGDKKAYDLNLLPQLMAEAIKDLQEARVEPGLGKIEGLDRQEDCEGIVAAARRGGRGAVGCIILGRGEDDTKVREWLTTAAAVSGFIGFAAGRASGIRSPTGVERRLRGTLEWPRLLVVISCSWISSRPARKPFRYGKGRGDKMKRLLA